MTGASANFFPARAQQRASATTVLFEITYAMPDKRELLLLRKQMLKHREYVELLASQDVTDRLSKVESERIHPEWSFAVHIYRQCRRGNPRYAHSSRYNVILRHSSQASIFAKQALRLLSRKVSRPKELKATFVSLHHHIREIETCDGLALPLIFGLDASTLQWVLGKAPPPCGSRCTKAALDPHCACEAQLHDPDPFASKITVLGGTYVRDMEELTQLEKIGYLRIISARLSIDPLRRRGPKSDDPAQDLIGSMCSVYEIVCGRNADHTNVELMSLISEFLVVYGILDINIEHRVKRYVALRSSVAKEVPKLQQDFIRRFGDPRERRRRRSTA